MNLASKKKLAAKILRIGVNRVWLDSDRAEDIKNAITREDLRILVREGAVRVKPKQSSSRGRARKIMKQKSKGRRKGSGSRKGTPRARLPRKRSWILKIRTQRKFFNLVRASGVVTGRTYQLLRRKGKGGFFRSRRHIKLFLENQGLFVKRGQDEKK